MHPIADQNLAPTLQACKTFRFLHKKKKINKSRAVPTIKAVKKYNSSDSKPDSKLTVITEDPSASFQRL